MGYGFRWNEWNVEHVGKHGVTIPEAESVVLDARRPYPSYEGDGKFLVRGRASAGRFLQVVYVVDDDGETLYVIHARPLTDKEKCAWRRRQP